MQTNIQTPQIATMAQEFLKRVDLKGAEVEAFAVVMNWLESQKRPAPISGVDDQAADEADAG